MAGGKHISLIQCVAEDARAVGAKLGEQVRDRIRYATEALADFEVFRLCQPWWLPFPLFRYLAEWRARGLLEPAVRQHYEEIAARIDGMSETTDVRLDTLYLFHAFESLLAMPPLVVRVPDPVPGLAACSAVVVRGRRSRNGDAIIHHNFDNLPLVAPLSIIRLRGGDDRYRCLEFTLAPLGGTIDGINEAGLCVTYNYASTTQPGPPAPPVSMAISRVLGRCATVREALRELRQQPVCGGAILMLADAAGDIARLELAGPLSRVVRPRGRSANEDVLFHSNRYTTRSMQEVEIDCDAVYSDAAPEELRNCRVLESADRREARLRTLLAERMALDGDELARLMSDHGPEDTPDANTICMHGAYWTTTACLQLFPSERRMRVAFDHACSAEYIDFAL